MYGSTSTWLPVIIGLSTSLFFFFKQKTAYEMRISDWSSDVCSSDLPAVYPTRFLRTIFSYRFESTLVMGTSFLAGSRSATHIISLDTSEIGRASCRERVCQYV